jgi:hypothetical protein
MKQTLREASYAFRSVFHLRNSGTIKSIYFPCSHFIMKLGIILEGTIVQQQKQIYSTKENYLNYKCFTQISPFERLQVSPCAMQRYIFNPEPYYN